MARISDTMEQHHKHCDEIFAAAESAAAEEDWEAAARAFDSFQATLEAHFGAEESVLFPAFEERTGMTGGPTAMMRAEHEQMRGLLEQMKPAVAAHDGERFGGAAQTLLILMQQHNMKEENILYPMCDQALADEPQVLAGIDDALAEA